MKSIHPFIVHALNLKHIAQHATAAGNTKTAGMMMRLRRHLHRKIEERLKHGSN